MATGLGFGFTWWGHSCVELRTPGGLTVLFDPWFANPSSTKEASAVEACDVMLVTHGHFDHLGDAVDIARRTSPVWPCIHELSLWLESELGEGTAEVIGMNKGGTVDARGLKVTMVHADHSAGNWVDETSTPLHLGEPVGLVVELEDGRRIINTGDTDIFGDMALIAELHRPDVAFLPIGGHYTMDPRRAAMAIGLLGVSTVVPLHYGTFPVLTGTPLQLRAALRERGLDSVEVISPEVGEAVGS